MGAADRLTKSIHVVLREDPYVKAIIKAHGLEIDNIEAVLQDLYRQLWFDTMTWKADKLADDMAISFPADMKIEDKRAIVEGRWKNSDKSDKYLLQLVADSWKNGETEVHFKNGKIEVKFVNEYGIPSDLESLKKELDNAKPAHLPILYLFRYLLIQDIHEVMTLEEMESMTLDKFASGGV